MQILKRLSRISLFFFFFFFFWYYVSVDPTAGPALAAAYRSARTVRNEA